MNGPKPVWMLATVRLSQSSPRAAAARGSAPLVRRIGMIGRRGRYGHGRDGARFLVFRGRLDLLPIKRERYRRIAIAGPEFERLPFDRNLAAADPEEAADIDHGRRR